MGHKSYRRGDPFNPADHPWKEVEVQEKKGRIVAITTAEAALPADPPPKPIEALSPRQQEAIAAQEEAKPIRRSPGRPKK